MKKSYHWLILDPEKKIYFSTVTTARRPTDTLEERPTILVGGWSYHNKDSLLDFFTVNRKSITRVSYMEIVVQQSLGAMSLLYVWNYMDINDTGRLREFAPLSTYEYYLVEYFE